MKLMPTSDTFKGWVGLLMFSVVTLGSIWDRYNETDYVMGSLDYWLLTQLVVSIGISAVMCIWYFFACRRGARDGARATEFNKYEAALVVFLFFWWIAGLATLMDRTKDYAVSSDGLIASANTYFAAWASMGSIVYILGEIGESHAETSAFRSPKLFKWWIMFVSALVTLVSCADIYINAGCSGLENDFCDETIVGLAFGSIGTFTSGGTIIVLSFWEEKFNRILETILSVILWILSCATVATVTSVDGPGAKVGNLYFASWVAFLVAFNLVGYCMGDLCGGGQTDNEEDGDDDGDDDDVPKKKKDVPKKKKSEDEDEEPDSNALEV